MSDYKSANFYFLNPDCIIHFTEIFTVEPEPAKELRQLALEREALTPMDVIPFHPKPTTPIQLSENVRQAFIEDFRMSYMRDQEAELPGK